MNKKVILISIDGMRPDGLKQCKSPYLDELLEKSSYTFNARTVFPSVTLPCHLSLFYSVPPERHGTLSNDFVKPVRPVDGLFEKLKACGKKAAMFTGWQHLLQVGRPGTMAASVFLYQYTFDHVDGILTDTALSYIKGAKPDFVFLYMGETDDKGGHDSGWMTDTYLEYINLAIGNAKRVIDEVGDEYTVIITADHGGHDRGHGTEMPEDMTIPMIFCGPEFEKGKEFKDVSILDITPTIADIMNVPPEREWEGKSLIK